MEPVVPMPCLPFVGYDSLLLAEKPQPSVAERLSSLISTASVFMVVVSCGPDHPPLTHDKIHKCSQAGGVDTWLANLVGVGHHSVHYQQVVVPVFVPYSRRRKLDARPEIRLSPYTRPLLDPQRVFRRRSDESCSSKSVESKIYSGVGAWKRHFDHELRGGDERGGEIPKGREREKERQG